VNLDNPSDFPTSVQLVAALGDIGNETLRVARERPLVAATMLDVVAPVSIVAEEGGGYYGRPGLAGHRPDGQARSTRFASSRVVRHRGGAVTVVAGGTFAGPSPTGSVRPTGGAALIAVTQLRNSLGLAGPPLRLPGLEMDRCHRIHREVVPAEAPVLVHLEARP